MKPTGLLALACAAMLSVACNNNGRSVTERTTDNNGNVVGTAGEAIDTSLSHGDRSFVDDVTYAGNAEVELGRLASDHASSPGVKKFAKMMVEDHTKAGNELKQIATQYSISQPTGLDDKHRDLKDRLSKMHGVDFDKAYMDAMVDGHKDVVDKLESRVDEVNRTATLTGKQEKDKNVKPETSKNSITASLNAWSANTLPAVKAHLDEAKSIQDSLKHPDRNSTASR